MIVDYIGKAQVQELCPEQQLRRVYVVLAAGGANLRNAPSVDAPKNGAIAEGTAVEDGVTEGDWVHVKTHMGSGYMHVSTLRPYLHQNIEW